MGKEKLQKLQFVINEFLIPLIHPTTIIITCLSQLGIKPNCGFDTSTQIINCQMFQTQYKYPGLIVQLVRKVDHVFFCLTGKLNTFFVLTHQGQYFLIYESELFSRVYNYYNYIKEIYHNMISRGLRMVFDIYFDVK